MELVNHIHQRMKYLGQNEEHVVKLLRLSIHLQTPWLLF